MSLDRMFNAFSCIELFDQQLDQTKISSAQSKLTIDEIRAMVDDPQICVTGLIEIEQKHYKPLVQRLVFGQTPAELHELVIVLDDLAKLAKKLGDLSGKLVHYTDAAIVHHHVLSILEEKLSDTEDLKVDPYECLGELQSRIFSFIGADLSKMMNFKEETSSYKAILESLRVYVKDKIQDTNMDTDRTRELFEYITKEMKNFLALVYRDSENQMGIPPPCSYAVIGLGSMALQQITPYSDLEFAILVENEDFRTDADPKVSDYFENLSHLAHFKVIGLGETEIAFSKYGVNTSHLVHVGVNFDLGGKTPLGRIGNDKPYNLVKTVDWMLHYVYNEEDKASHIDKNLPYILENVCYVYGDENLVTTYQTKIAEFLASRNKNDPANRLNCEIRACKLLEEGAVEFDYCRKTLDGLHRQVAFKGDLDKLKPTLLDNEGVYFNVKQEIYRLPDRMIYNFGLFFNVRGSSGWDIIDKLCIGQILCERATLNLKRAVSFATQLRLKIYLHYKAQDEGMSIFSKQNDLETGFLQLSVKDLGEESKLFQYFFSALPLFEMLSKFCKRCRSLTIKEKREFFRECEFFRNDSLSKGMVYFRLAQYEDAERSLRQGAELTQGKEKYLISRTLSEVYERLCQWDLAIEQYQFCVGFLEHSDDAKRLPELAIAYIKLGTAFNLKGQYDKAIECFETGLKLSTESKQIISTILLRLGDTFTLKGQYDIAKNYFKQSLMSKTEISENQSALFLVSPLAGLGWVYLLNEEYDKAVECYEETLRIERKLFGNEPHMDVATTLVHLAAVLREQGENVQAIKYLEMSLQMQRVILKARPHSCLAKTLSYLGLAHETIGQNIKEKEYLEESLQMERVINQGTNHPDLAGALHNLGRSHFQLGERDLAKAYFEEALTMLRVIHENKNHPDIAIILNNLGMVHSRHIECSDKSTPLVVVHKEEMRIGEEIANEINTLNSYWRFDQFDKALAYFKLSLEMREQIFNVNPHPSIAASHLNIAATYRKMGRLEQALVHFEKATQTQRLVYGDIPPPEVQLDMADTLRQKGNVLQDIGYHDQATECFVKALAFERKVHMEQPNERVADLLFTLGHSFERLNQFDKALTYHEQSLIMREQILNGASHTSIADSHHCIGTLHQKMEHLEKALLHYAKAQKIQNSLYGDCPPPEAMPGVTNTLNNMGVTLQEMGRCREAVEYFEICLSILKEVPHEGVADLLTDLGILCDGLNQSDKALMYFERSLEIRERIFQDSPHLSVATAYYNLGTFYAKLGRVEEALVLCDKACEIQKYIRFS